MVALNCGERLARAAGTVCKAFRFRARVVKAAVDLCAPVDRFRFMKKKRWHSKDVLGLCFSAGNWRSGRRFGPFWPQSQLQSQHT